MPKYKARASYILSLLVLAGLLVLFAQGVFSGLFGESPETVAEINRIDLYDDVLGNYSKVSVFLVNNDTISHDFSINTFYDGDSRNSHNITVDAHSTFSYGMDVLPDRIPISPNETINSTLRVAKIVVYMDNKPEPFEEASFVFKNE
ncbi:hypothetical protein [uncultured Methanomethylovorans sp.]|uniref:hypothetical protein n=1 Tax=uncultured Methanomethylovorans sp. TaxID=183759 RepID=UPI002AA64E17|nr:hypothetical protein [uncultured Methanomethylovorans sp.]